MLPFYAMVSLQLLNHVRQQLAAGVSREDISGKLVENGWNVADIHEAFAHLPQFAEPSQPATPVVAGALTPVGQLFKDSWDLYRQRLPVVVNLLIIPYAFFLAAQVARPAGGILTPLCFLIGLLAFIPAVAAAVLSISKGSGFSDSLRQGVRLFFPALWLFVLIELVTIGGVIMFVVPGILMGIWFSFAIFVLVVEGRRGLGALLQSKEYTRGYWWAIFVRLLLVNLLILVAVFVIQSLVSLALGAAVGMLAYYLLSALLMPFSLAYSYALYRSLASLKPALIVVSSKTERGFFIASGVLGFLAPVILVLGVIALFLLGKAAASPAAAATIGVATSSAPMIPVPLQ